jgi:hypothetical protein
MTVSSQGTEHALSANRLAQYATRRGRCERYLCFSLFPSEERILRRRYNINTEPLSPLLSGEGMAFERETVAKLATRIEVRDLTNDNHKDFISALAAQAPGRVCYYQPFLRGAIGNWDCEGRADLIDITRAGDEVAATVIDIKASRRESVGFRLQVAFYTRLLQAALIAAGLKLTEMRGAILARDADLEGDPFHVFDLTLYDDEIDRLIGAENSDVERVATKPFSEARYHLGPKCDGCQYNPICFIETAEREDLSLVPHLSAVEKRALQMEGLTTARELAGLMDYGAKEMVPAFGGEERASRISRRWPLGGRLPILVQRARAAIHHYDEGVEVKSYLLGGAFSTLPDAERYPELVKLFIDAQPDYINDRLYLIAARVAGPRGGEEIVEMTAGPPDTDAERILLLNWLSKLLPAVRRAAESDRAPVHVYLYDRRDQSALLDALTRHFEALAALPVFYDLLTSSPALSQQMISFLGDEVRGRRNLAPVCQNLYRTARALGFDWQDGELAFWRRFRARAFDNQKSFRRDLRTGLFHPAERGAEGESYYVESAARFGTQIPLEYAYAAWNRLGESREMNEQERALIRSFNGVTTEEIRQLALHRTRALAHLEARLAGRNPLIGKEPLDLSRLDETTEDPKSMPLNRALENFLLLEHYSRLQELLLHFAQPPELRAQTGRTAILDFERLSRDVEGDKQSEVAIFHFAVAPDLDTLRLRAGDWVVLNPETNPGGGPRAAGQLVHGRLATIARIDATEIALRLLPLSFKDSPFRYWHARIEPRAGIRYTIDAIADDLNADKYLDACRHAEANHLYRWMSDPQTGRAQRRIRPSRLRAAGELAELASRVQAPAGLTLAQRQLLSGGYHDRVLVVQGPPGTGKSHTIGLAIIARMLSLKSRARSFRVAVAAKTHAATEIVLRSVAARLRELRAAFPDDERWRQLDGLRIVKIARTADEPMPEGVAALPIYSGDFSAGLQWLGLLQQPFVVVGGTPGGLYTLIKRGAGEIDWAKEYFDLVVVDEASQMGIAEALAAAAFVRSDGQFIAVGDHRQMPPILTHTWDEEARRDLAKARPHLSIFEYLQRLGFPQAPLDESFRIPAEIADFLRRHVYAHDKIDFRSQQRRRLNKIDHLDGQLHEWLAAVFAPEHSMILVEHDEEGSQQSNQYESELAAAIAEAATKQLGLNATEGLGIVVPHRAQKALLAARLPELAGAIDTVERFQGGERELIIVSATVSDREYAQAESSFLLDPRRLTVAISRPKRKLIILASRTVFDLIAEDLDEYERGALWKRLHHEARGGVLWEGEVGGHRVSVRSLTRVENG